MPRLSPGMLRAAALILALHPLHGAAAQQAAEEVWQKAAAVEKPAKPADGIATETKAGDSKAEKPSGDNSKESGEAKPAEPKWTMEWKKDGLHFEKGKQFDFHVGGLIQYDFAMFGASQAISKTPGPGQFHDGAAPRRLRLRAEGTLYEDFDYIIELDFASTFSSPGATGGPSATTSFDTPAVTDVFVTAKKVPWLGNVRIGNQKEPFSLEALNSIRLITFMERSYLFDATQVSAFNNNRSPGVQFFRTWEDDRYFGSAGVFKNISDPYGFGVGDGQYAATTRWGWLPVYEPKCEQWWWVGAAYSHRDAVNGQARVRIRNSVRASPNAFTNVIADTGTFNADSQQLVNLQTAAGFGPLTLQLEYVANLIHNAQLNGTSPIGDVIYHGWYVETLWLLTGEHRPWDAPLARTGIVKPRSNLRTESGSCGWGAWELAARYQMLTLVDSPINGGRLDDVTLGVNWYWNPNIKMQFNYDFLWRDPQGVDAAKGGLHSFGTRLAMFF